MVSGKLTAPKNAGNVTRVRTALRVTGRSARGPTSGGRSKAIRLKWSRVLKVTAAIENRVKVMILASRTELGHYVVTVLMDIQKA